MIKFLTSILLLVVSLSSLAQSTPTIVSPITNEGLFGAIEVFNQRFLAVLISAFQHEYINVWVSYTIYATGLIYVMRSFYEFHISREITIKELITGKFLYLVFIFWISVPINFFTIMNAVSVTSHELAKAIHIAILGGSGEWSSLPKIIYILFRNITISHDAIGIFSMTLGILLGIYVVSKYIGVMIEKLIYVLSLMAFSYLGFDVLIMLGYVLIPLFLIKELRFLAEGFVRSVVFLFVFVLVLKCLMILGATLIIYAFFGNALFLLIQAPGGLDLMYQNLHLIQGFSFGIGGLWDYFAMFFFVIVGLAMIISALPISMFIITGFANSLNNVTRFRA